LPISLLPGPQGITRRSQKVGDQTFNEATLPVGDVAEYFEHFPLVEIDYPLREGPKLSLAKEGCG